MPRDGVQVGWEAAVWLPVFGFKGNEVFSMGWLSFPISSGEAAALPSLSAAAPCCCRTLVFSAASCKHLSLGKTHLEEGLPPQGFVQGVMLCALFFRGLGLRMLSSPSSFSVCISFAPSWLYAGGLQVSQIIAWGTCFGKCPCMGLDEFMPLGGDKGAAPGALPLQQLPPHWICSDGYRARS